MWFSRIFVLSWGMFLSTAAFSADVRVEWHFMDGTSRSEKVVLTKKASSEGVADASNVEFLEIPRHAIPTGVRHFEVHHPDCVAHVGDDGFYVFNNGMYGEFREREKSARYTHGATIMPMFGVRTPRGAFTVIQTGLRFDSQYVVTYQKETGQYDVFLNYVLNGEKPDADLGIQYHRLPPTATYAEVARYYRNYQLHRGACVPLRERVKNNPELKYAAESMEVRVRQAWKPVPSPVGEQTAENEPEVGVKITFDRFRQIVDEFQRQGIREAEFCLVGWNVGGHDGRWPQVFPVEPKLGGEEKLREAIRYAQERGYQVVCHTNNFDAYHASSIGGLWDWNYLIVRKDGIRTTRTWGGGNVYQTCPQCVYERFVQSDQKRIRELGFRGVHYIDVYTIWQPERCYSAEHPLTKEENVQWCQKIFETTQRTFGGFGSESGYDFAIGNVDYALYVSFHDPGKVLRPEENAKVNAQYNPTRPLPALVDRHTPFWQLVYSGIVLQNPFCATTNYTLKDPISRLKLVEYGGRPMFYFYSGFLAAGANWMGERDITCGTDAELRESVAKIREGYEEFQKLRHLQYAFMENHEPLAQEVFCTTFSDGTRIVTNYSDRPFLCEGRSVAPLGYVVFEGNSEKRDDR
ncbi:MAG: DUF5696 domain-containing protein [Planctomycetia bacterium]|nr:DUF5696 domain-containing protein [Planctomycetia bacterium]